MHSTPARFKGQSLCCLTMAHRYVWTPHQVIAYYHTQQLGRCNSLYGFLFDCYSWDIRRDMPQKHNKLFCLTQLTHMMLLAYHSTASVAVCWIWLLTADGEHTSHSCIDGTLSSPTLFRCSLSHNNEVTSRNVFHSEQIHNLLTCFQFHVYISQIILSWCFQLHNLALIIIRLIVSIIASIPIFLIIFIFARIYK